MKTSKYNYFISQESGKMLVFNGRTKRFFEVSERNATAFRDIIENPTAEKFEQYKLFYLRMRDEGFVLEDEVDEFKLIVEDYNRMRGPQRYMLLVYTTYQCNLRCWYCIQQHKDLYMSKEIANRLKKHISKYLLENKIKEFDLAWFGGEPLLSSDLIVDITTYAKDFCEKHHISFVSGITSNGLLLTDDLIRKFREINLYNYQITLDGAREQHNKVKKMEGQSAFDITLTNIKSLIELMPEANLNLRINYTEKLDINQLMTEINEIIPYYLHKRIKISPRKVWQVQEERISQKLESDLREKIVMNNFIQDCQTMGLCYVANKHFHTIFPDGGVTKCDNDELKEARGFLDEAGNIVFHKENVLEKFDLLGEQSVCAGCSYLPICWGPCPKTINRMLESTGKVTCYHNDLERHIRNYIDDFVVNFKCE